MLTAAEMEICWHRFVFLAMARARTPLTTGFPDIDEKSFEFAKRNIKANEMQNRIKVLKMRAEDPLIPLDALGLERYDAEKGWI